MANITKILKILFVVFILVTTAEVGYYFLYLNTKKINDKVTSSSEQLAENNNQDNNNIDLDKKNSTDSSEQKEFVPLISDDILKFLSDYEKTEVNEKNKKFYLIQQDEGFISELNLDNTKQTLDFKIVDEKGQRVTDYKLTNDQLSNPGFIKFQTTSGDGNKNITYKDLKDGDKIIAKFIQNMVNYSDKRIEFIIIL